MVTTPYGKPGKPGKIMEKNSVWKSHGKIMEKSASSGKMN